MDIWVTRRATRNDLWAQPENLGPVVNSSTYDDASRISTDGLELYFSSRRLGGYLYEDIWVTKRATKKDPWGTPVNLGPMVNTSSLDCGATLSPDGHALYFTSERPGGLGGPYGDIYQAPIMPIVDFNGDGIVDAADMCFMIDHWGENYSLCDIGPMPWGDGIVDVEDLKILAEHLFGDVNDPTLIAHWPLDEAQGVIAYDNTSDCDGTLMNGPVWLPDGGMVAGALQFDGIDDCVSTDFVLNPANSAFSVVVWIKGGAPGQVVLSQAGAANWLCMDPVEGRLITELKVSGRFKGDPLSSEAIINDGNWHRIASVWDGSYRHLYVDGDEVAMDASPTSSLEDAYGGIYFGTGKAMEPGSFWSGLIDDVRIYNRAVKP